MLTSIVVGPINHVLDGESWACRRLQVYTGKIVCIHASPLFDLNFSVQNDGKLRNVSGNNHVDAEITLTPAMFFRILANDHTVFKDIRISGDEVFSQELIHISKHLRWDLEQDLSGIVGDIFSHRMVQAGNYFAHWHLQGFRNLTQALAEYWVEEQPILASKILINEFNQNVDSLHLEVNQLEKRIQQLIDQ